MWRKTIRLILCGVVDIHGNRRGHGSQHYSVEESGLLLLHAARAELMASWETLTSALAYSCALVNVFRSRGEGDSRQQSLGTGGRHDCAKPVTINHVETQRRIRFSQSGTITNFRPDEAPSSSRVCGGLDAVHGVLLDDS